MANPQAAMLVIGDEILSGRTKEANIYHLAGALTGHGIDLREVRIVADDANAIIIALRTLSDSYDLVFSSGGIGPTHDDITADCVARAFGLGIGIREDARALMAAHYARQGMELNEARLRMARIPKGAALIENPVSAAPGFIVKNVYVMAGVPAVFRAMVESVLPHLGGGRPLVSESVRVDRPEGEIAQTLARLVETYLDLRIGCYPYYHDGVPGANIVVRGSDVSRVQEAISRIVRDVAP